MFPSLHSRGWIIVPLALSGGVALGTLLPEKSNGVPRPAPQDQKAAPEASAAPSKESADTGGTAAFPGAGEGGDLSKLPPEKVLALFERISKLKSDSRRYALAYRLASQLGLEQIGPALDAAMKDLEDGDYVTARAVARRWVELDPTAAAKKGLESKQGHLVWPVMEAWSRLNPGAPLQWALQQDAALQVDAIRPLLTGRLLDDSQLQDLVMAAAGSEAEAMQKQILPMATARLAETKPDSALHTVEHLPEGDVKMRTTVMVLSTIAQKNPEAARAWIAAQPGLTPSQRQSFEQAVNSPRPAGNRQRN